MSNDSTDKKYSERESETLNVAESLAEHLGEYRDLKDLWDVDRRLSREAISELESYLDSHDSIKKWGSDLFDEQMRSIAKECAELSEQRTAELMKALEESFNPISINSLKDAISELTIISPDTALDILERANVELDDYKALETDWSEVGEFYTSAIHKVLEKNP